jgi:hypothetical protein
MARGPLRFRQADVSRALKAFAAAGVPVARVEVGKDGVTIVPGEPVRGSTKTLEARLAEIDAAIRRPIGPRKRG